MAFVIPSGYNINQKGIIIMFSVTYLPLEVQLFHFNAKYETMEEARTKDDGILALATFFQVCISIWYD